MLLIQLQAPAVTLPPVRLLYLSHDSGLIDFIFLAAVEAPEVSFLVPA